MKLTLSLCLFFAVLSLSFAQESKDYKETEAKIVSVHDGDTAKVDINGTVVNVRMAGLDAPELLFLGKTQNYSQEATDYLKSLIPVGTVVKLMYKDQNDPYNRMIGFIFLDGVNINLKVVEAGWAVPYFYYPELKFFEEFSKASEDAHKAKIGIFDEAAPLDLMPYDFRRKIKKDYSHSWAADASLKKFYRPSKSCKIAPFKILFFLDDVTPEKAGYTFSEPAIKCPALF